MKIFGTQDSELQLDDGTPASPNAYTSDQAGSVASLALSSINIDPERSPVIAAFFDIGAIDTADADETYRIRIDWGDDSSFTNILAQDYLDIDTSAHQDPTIYTIVSNPTNPGVTHVRAFFDVGGTTPSIASRGVYLTGVQS